MPHNRGTHGSTASHDEELGDVNQSREASRHEDHDPAISGHGVKDGDFVHEGDGEEEHNRADWCLVEQKLGGRHGELLMICPNKDRVNAASANT